MQWYPEMFLDALVINVAWRVPYNDRYTAGLSSQSLQVGIFLPPQRMTAVDAGLREPRLNMHHQ